MAGKGSGPYKNEFQRDGDNVYVNDEMKHAFWENGFVVVKGLFDKEEMDQVNKALAAYSDVIDKYSYRVPDAHGRGPNFMLWNYPGDDVLGMMARCHKVAGTSEQLMGGDEMYHYGSKLTMKEPRTGGRFEWHQDYGYWYKNGVLTDELNSVFIALDPCTRENGGLQVLVGSHKAGRIDHNFTGGQQGADLERLEHLRKIYPHHYVEISPGDVIFTHSNLLHASGPNESEIKRWALICVFNKKKNNPVIKHCSPFYNPLKKVENNAIRECKNYCDPEGRGFVDPAADKTVKAGPNAEKQ